MIYAWSLGAALLAVGMEAAFAKYGYWALWPWIMVPAVLIGYCISHIVRGSATLIDATAVFAFTNLILRMVASRYIGQPITTATWTVAGLLTLANIVRHLSARH